MTIYARPSWTPTLLPGGPIGPDLLESLMNKWHEDADMSVVRDWAWRHVPEAMVALDAILASVGLELSGLGLWNVYVSSLDLIVGQELSAWLGRGAGRARVMDWAPALGRWIYADELLDGPTRVPA